MVRDSSDRDRIIAELVAKGFSLRRAEKAFRSVFGLLKEALGRGEEVELPFGKLAVEPAPERRAQLQMMHKLSGKKKYVLLVKNKRRKRVVLKRNKNFRWE